MKALLALLLLVPLAVSAAVAPPLNLGVVYSTGGLAAIDLAGSRRCANPTPGALEAVGADGKGICTP